MAKLAHLREALESTFDGPLGRGVAGAVVGISIDGVDLLLSHGVANLNTGAPFTSDTGWLLGSVTKTMTTTLLMQLVERGSVELDAPVRNLLPEFGLRDTDAADAMTVRMLVNHTNGIDADDLMPDGVRGRDAGRSYTDLLPQMGTVFEPGCGIHYSNPGFVLASRIVEEQMGQPFERAIATEVFAPCGMQDATAVQTQALLRRTAVGAFATEDGGMRAAHVFSLPESAAGAGSTLVVTAADMLAFGRMHLCEGLAPTGRRVLSAESARAMGTQTYDLGIPQAPPIGLGWWLFPIAGTTALWHGGGSPGGLSSVTLLPEHGAVIVSFASGRSRSALNDELHLIAIEQITGRRVDPPFCAVPTAPRQDVAGEYESFQERARLEVGEGHVVLSTRFEPFDEGHRRTLVGYSGVEPSMPPTRFDGVGPDLFAAAGSDRRHWGAFYGRMGLLATLPAAAGRPAGLHRNFRHTPRAG